MPDRTPRTALNFPQLLPPALLAKLPERIASESEAGVCWVYAAPGAGKTCAIRAWAHQCASPVHWHEVQPQDRDPVACALALWRLFAGPHDPGLAGFQQRIDQIGVRTAWELLLDELDARLSDQTWIVVDGLDEADALVQHPVWSALLLREFRALRFVVSSCEPVPGSWSRWLVNRHIVCFGFEDLCWSFAEAKAWVQHWGFDALASDEPFLRRVLEQSQGWGAGVEYLVRRAALDDRAPLVPGMQILWTKLLSASKTAPESVGPWPVLHALGQLGEVSLGLVRELDPTGAVREQLGWLAGRGFLVQLRNDQQSSVYQFHPMFCDLLGQVGQVSELSSTDARDVAGVFVREGQCLAGLALLARTRCWDSFVHNLEANGVALCELPSLQDLAEPLSRLPAEFLAADKAGGIAVLTGISLMETEPVRAMELLKAALERPQAPFWRAITLDVLARRAMLLGHQAFEIEAYVNAIDELLDTSAGQQLPDARRLSLTLCAMMGALLVCPWHPGLEGWRDRALDFQSESFAGPKVASLTATVAKAYALTGCGEYAKQMLRRLQFSEHTGMHEQTRTAILVASFFVCVFSGRFEDIVPISDELETHWERPSTVVWRGEVQLFSAFAALCVGDRARLALSLSRYKASEAAASPFSSICAPLLDALLGASKSDYDQIIDGQQRCLVQSQKLGIRFYECVIRASMALNLLEIDRRQEALSHLSGAELLSDRLKMPTASWCVSLVKAYLAMSEGNAQRCSGILSEVFGQMSEAGCFMLPLHFHRGFSDLLIFALEQGIEVGYLVDFIRRSKKYHHYVESAAWPAKFELSVMGGFSLRIDGQDKTSRFRQAAHRFELLTALMYLGGRDVSESELIACVWPYVRNDARARLRQAIRRLSQSLGRADAILWSEGMVSLNPKLWQYDLWALREEVQAYRQRGACVSSEPEVQMQRLRLATMLGRDFVGPTQLPVQLRESENFDVVAWPGSPPGLRAQFA